MANNNQVGIVVNDYINPDGNRVMAFKCEMDDCGEYVPTTQIGRHIHDNHCETCQFNKGKLFGRKKHRA